MTFVSILDSQRTERNPTVLPFYSIRFLLSFSNHFVSFFESIKMRKRRTVEHHTISNLFFMLTSFRMLSNFSQKKKNEKERNRNKKKNAPLERRTHGGWWTAYAAFDQARSHALRRGTSSTVPTKSALRLVRDRVDACVRKGLRTRSCVSCSRPRS